MSIVTPFPLVNKNMNLHINDYSLIIQLIVFIKFQSMKSNETKIRKSTKG